MIIHRENFARRVTPSCSERERYIRSRTRVFETLTSLFFLRLRRVEAAAIRGCLDGIVFTIWNDKPAAACEQVIDLYQYTWMLQRS
jgi:hypothetical protein